jgi:hypothetical protein
MTSGQIPDDLMPDDFLQWEQERETPQPVLINQMVYILFDFSVYKMLPVAVLFLTTTCWKSIMHGKVFVIK